MAFTVLKQALQIGANRCLVSACKREDLDIICIVLGADTKKNRTQDSIKLIEYAFSNFEMVDINSIVDESFSKWQYQFSNNFFINKGISNNVETHLDYLNFSKYPVNKSNIENIKVEIDCLYDFEAPLLANTKLGTLRCHTDNTEICNLSIYSSKTVLKKNIFYYLGDFFKNYCIHLESICNL